MEVYKTFKISRNYSLIKCQLFIYKSHNTQNYRTQNHKTTEKFT